MQAREAVFTGQVASLFGRESERTTLAEAWERARSEHSFELTLVSGEPGIGKSALVEAHLLGISPRDGVVLRTKCLQFMREPFFLVRSLLASIAGHLLSGDDAAVASWRERLRVGIGEIAPLLLEMQPKFAPLLGRLDPPTFVDPGERRNQATRAMVVLLQELSMAAPLSIFLDDIHWADTESIGVIDAAAREGGAGAVHLIVAFRRSELQEIRGLKQAVDELERGIKAAHLALPPIPPEAIELLCLEQGIGSGSLPDSITRLLHVACGGNPLFAVELCKQIQRSGLAEGSYAALAVDQVPATLAELLATRLGAMKPGQQRVLKAAAVLGRDASPADLSGIMGESRTHVTEQLELAREAGMLTLADHDQPLYRFTHDRVRQAAYEALSSAEAASLHYRAGSYLASQSSVLERSERLYEVVYHLNHAQQEQGVDRLELARLNAAAAERALRAAAYSSSREYAELAVRLLPANSWSTAYEISLRAFVAASRAAAAVSNLPEARRLADLVFHNVESILDAVPVYETLIRTLYLHQHVHEAVETGIRGLRELGVRIPAGPDSRDIHRGRSRLRRLRGSLLATRVQRLPRMKDARPEAALDLLAAISLPVFHSDANLLPTVALEMVRLTLKHGLAPASPLGFVWIAFHLAATGEESPESYRFGELGMKILDRIPESRYRTKCRALYLFFVHHRRNSVKKMLPELLDVYRQALDAGDYEFAAHSIHVYLEYSLHAGAPLVRTLLPEIDIWIARLKRLGQPRAVLGITIGYQAIVNLVEGAPSPWIIRGPYFDEVAMAPRLRDAGDISLYQGTFGLKAIVAVHMGEYELGRSYLDVLFDYPGIEAMFDAGSYKFLYCLASYARGAPLPERTRVFEQSLRRSSLQAPENYAHRAALIEAERARIRGKESRARAMYRQAIELARKHGFVHEQALSCERAGLFDRELHHTAAAEMLLREAYRLYALWGARSKTRLMAKEHGDWIDFTSVGNEEMFSRQTQSLSDLLDLQAVARATALFNRKTLVPDEFTERLLSLFMEVSEADYGALLLGTGTGRKVHALKFRCWSSSIPEAGETSHGCTDLEHSEGLPRFPGSVVNYVVHTGEALSYRRGDFPDFMLQDAYLNRRSPAAIVCVPIQYREELRGVVYLEEAGSAVILDRVELVRLLADQAGISLENVALYGALQRREQSLGTLLDSLEEAVLLTDAAGAIQTLNEEALALLGVRRADEAVGLDLLSLLPAEAAEKTREGLSASVARESAHDHEINIGERTYLCRVRPTLAEDNGIIGHAVTYRDITDERKLEEAERERQRQLIVSDKLASIGVLATGVAHEINNPNQAILMHSVFLERSIRELMSELAVAADDGAAPRVDDVLERLRSRLPEALSFIASSARSIDSIVQDLKSFARDESHHELEPVDVNEVCRRAVRMSAHFTAKHTQDLRVILPRAPVVVRGHAQKLQQVVINLVRNACEALTDRQQSVELRIDTDSDLEEAILSVRDEGTGMSEEVLRRVPSPFFTTKQSSGGTGLGLSVCTAIVQEHSGSLRFISRSGVGTTAVVRLPLDASKAY